MQAVIDAGGGGAAATNAHVLGVEGGWESVKEAVDAVMKAVDEVRLVP
jgi:hypothetical protein